MAQRQRPCDAGRGPGGRTVAAPRRFSRRRPVGSDHDRRVPPPACSRPDRAAGVLLALATLERRAPGAPRRRAAAPAGPPRGPQVPYYRELFRQIGFDPADLPGQARPAADPPARQGDPAAAEHGVPRGRHRAARPDLGAHERLHRHAAAPAAERRLPRQRRRRHAALLRLGRLFPGEEGLHAALVHAGLAVLLPRWPAARSTRTR